MRSGADPQPFFYELSALFLGASWTFAARPSFQFSFWLLNYEAWYYMLFALRLFCMNGDEFCR
jgi:hypothetical protein